MNEFRERLQVMGVSAKKGQGPIYSKLPIHKNRVVISEGAAPDYCVIRYSVYLNEDNPGCLTVVGQFRDSPKEKNTLLFEYKECRSSSRDGTEGRHFQDFRRAVIVTVWDNGFANIRKAQIAKKGGQYFLEVDTVFGEPALVSEGGKITVFPRVPESYRDIVEDLFKDLTGVTSAAG